MIAGRMQTLDAQLDNWVRRYGTSSNSYVLLEGPKSYFTSPVRIVEQRQRRKLVSGLGANHAAAHATSFIRRLVMRSRG